MRTLLLAGLVCVPVEVFAQLPACPADKPRIPVRVTWVCPTPEETSAGKRCKERDPLTSDIVRAQFSYKSRDLPVCLEMQGQLRTTFELSKKSKSWTTTTDTTDILKDSVLRAGPRWDVLDIFVIEQFASIRADRSVAGQVGGIGYQLRKSVAQKSRERLCLSRDGMVITKYALTNASSRTLHHEIGHWLGLFHTFSGCGAKGDEISDTIDEDERDEGIEYKWQKPGADQKFFVRCQDVKLLQSLKERTETACGVPFNAAALRNFMEYTGCRGEWSDGQKQVMLDVWSRRLELARAASPPTCIP